MNAISPIAEPAVETFYNERCEELRVDCLKVDEAPPFRRYKFTVADLRALIDAQLIGEKAHIELLDGELIAVPSEGTLHLSLKIDLTRYLIGVLPAEIGLVVDGTIHLANIDAPDPDFYAVEPGTTLEPVDRSRVALVIEIAVSSRRYDLGKKRRTYARHDLTEYWVIDARNETTHVFRDPHEGDYRTRFQVPFDGVLSAERLPSIALRMNDLPVLR